MENSKIEWTDHTFNPWVGCRRRLVGLMLDGSHHGKCEHDERDVTMPAMPRSGFVVVEPELVLGSLKAVLDRPAVAFDADKCFD